MLKTLILVGILALTPLTTFAESTSVPFRINDSTLQLLYRKSIISPNDAYIQKRIVDERATIRRAIERELKRMVSTTEEEESEALEAMDLPSALDKQRTLLGNLRERLGERTVDLDLLRAEEQQYYANGEEKESQEDDAFRLTNTYEQLLAQKAILEERVSVLNQLISLQQSRLQQLQQSRLKQQFSIFSDYAIYIFVLFGVWLFERLVRRLLLVRIQNRARRYTTTKAFTGTVYTLLALWILIVLFSSNPGFLASFAIVGAGLAIALQDVVKNIIGWLIIQQSGIFNRGDRITVGMERGEVIDIGILHTRLLEIGQDPNTVLEQTGKVLTLPNGIFLTQPVTNEHSTSDYVRAEMRFAITFESNWEKAEEILGAILEEETSQYGERDKSQRNWRTRMLFVSYEPAPWSVMKDIAADGVQFTLRFTTPIGRRRGVVSSISGKVLSAFNKEKDIDLAYTTQRIIAEVN